MDYSHTKLSRKHPVTNKISQYKLKKKDIAKAFKYSSANSFANSNAKDDILAGIEWVIKQIEAQLIK